jgi:anti-anti-sigma regulatory factor
MAFSIVCTRPGSIQLVLRGELDTATASLLRRELATVMAANPRDVEVRFPDHAFVGGVGLHLVESFFDIMWARGCRFTFARGSAPSGPVTDGPMLRRLLTGRDDGFSFSSRA